MGAIAIITLILAVPAALVAIFSLFERAKGRQDDTDPDTPERGAAQYAYELTCVYAPKAFLVVSFFSFNYQNANPTVQNANPAAQHPVSGTEANNVVEHGIEDNDEPNNDVIGGLPRPVQDRRQQRVGGWN
ncbi:hypothetical protein BFW01_g10082 [Lasiodiplodia theobromae]|nr:hypothetical protein BFW01_g10082 [Lasiodiplodia theobromae]